MARVASELNSSDKLGAWKARWGIGRMSYLVPPGLYALGKPTTTDPVVVTANYKMSYDLVRRALAGRNAWLLVLETYGINVWCAAGKGTFGTGELVRRIAASRLPEIVSHRQVILPILGAAGVSASEVARRSGFNVSYATIRAADLPGYLDAGMSATPAMRELTFSLYERLVLIPVELVLALKQIAGIGVAVLLLGAILADFSAGITASCAWLGAALAGIVFGPLLLPWLPGRAFALKGAESGLLWCCLFYTLAGREAWNGWVVLAAFLVLPAISSFYTLNFTGCTPFTSRTGVKKELRIALPAIGLTLLTGVILLLAGRFL